MRASGATLTIVLVGALGGLASGIWPLVEARLPQPALVSFGGAVPNPAQPVARWLAERAGREAARPVAVRHGDATLLVPRSSLGLELDTERALTLLTRPRPPLGLLTRLRIAAGGPAPTPVDLAPSYRLDPARAAAWLSDVAPALRLEPVSARLDLSAHTRTRAVPGRELDAGTSLARLAALGDGTEVTLAFTELAPAVPDSALADVDPTQVLSEYETDFAKRGGPRVKNIARAAAYLDGTVMAPGATWSFNRTVGPRTEARGFVNAPVIVADELEPGVGGGVCQVATTLFAAAVLGGLDVVARRSHSRPSGYAPLGLDATVIDGEVDLQLKNPYPVPVIVHAYLPVPTRIRVEMLGATAPGRIEHSSAVIKSEDFYRRVSRHDELLPDQVKRQQKGIPGYDVVSTVRTRYVDGSERVRRYGSRYYPVPEIYWVGSSVELQALPPLPERATHSELQEGPAVTPAGFAP